MSKQVMLVAVAAASLWVVPRLGTAQVSAQQGTIGQSGSSSSSRQTGASLPPIDGRSQEERDDPNSAMREAQRTRSFANERQKRMVQDTEKLLALATELKADMDKTNKNEMSMDVIKKADEIERLAHDVKMRMKG